MPETTDWTSAVAILTAGLIVGALIVYFFAKRRTAPPPADMELRDLEAKRDLLVERLRSEVSPDERTRLEVEAAQVLRAIDAHNATRRVNIAAPPAEHAAPPASRNAALVGFAWGAGSVLALGGLLYLVTRSAEPRQDEAVQAVEQTQTDPVVARLEAAVRRSPDDLDARVDLAQAYLERDHLMGVFEQTQYVLTKAPGHSRALTYQALVRMAMGQQSEALQMLEQATRSDPTLLDAWVGLAWVRMQDGKQQEAEAAIQEAIRRRPEEKERLQQVFAQMVAQRQSAASQQPGGSLPPDHPPIAPAPGAAPADGQGIRVTLQLDPSARAKRGVVFVIARAEGVTSGPPIAAKRIDAASLPVTFNLTSADSMMGQPLPARVRLDARLDEDGNAATRAAGEPSGSRDSVAIGSAVRLTLR